VRVLMFALGAFFIAGSAQAAPASALQKCRMIERLPDENLEEIAAAAGTTVANLRDACRELRRPEPTSYYPRGRARPAAPRTPRKPPHSGGCDCGANEVCVLDYLRWKCVSNNGPDNRCTLQGDCAQPGSRCVGGRCT